ncbi:hypothetical protein MAR_037850 [Mya arenaria]|uniref:Uncharacterized protein n=1 Tax=Mya arenaria TaxID=6604 RepID=A0ABY7FTJ6_MYAAR|nr:hypothetical protein MAR_037850 [Mya arenaria]
MGQPTLTSSPIANNTPANRPKMNKIRILVVNFQLVKTKAAEINYEGIRKDRNDGYGGVLLAIKRSFTIETIDLPSEVGAVFAKITLTKNQSLVVGSLIRLPSSTL